jgi:hypothetical protein
MKNRLAHDAQPLVRMSLKEFLTPCGIGCRGRLDPVLPEGLWSGRQVEELNPECCVSRH